MSHQITVAGKIFTFTPRYAAGHTLTENEAASLNQTLGENVGNNFRAKVKEADAAGTYDHDTMQAEFNKYVTEYEFGVRRAAAPRTPVDPLQAEIQRLATEAVKAAIRKAGLTSVAKEAIAAKVEQVLSNEENVKRLTTTAKTNLKSLEAITGGEDNTVVEGLESGPKRKRKTKANAGETDEAQAA